MSFLLAVGISFLLFGALAVVFSLLSRQAGRGPGGLSAEDQFAGLVPPGSHGDDCPWKTAAFPAPFAAAPAEAPAEQALPVAGGAR